MRLQFHKYQFTHGELKKMMEDKCLYEIGSPKLDGEIQEVPNFKYTQYKTFFYAPTYHVEISSIFSFSDTIIKYITKRDIKLYIKLHPGLYFKNSYSHSGGINWKKRIQKLAERNINIELIQDNTSFSELKKLFKEFDLIITDTSAMAYEFTLVSGKPAVFIGENLKIPLQDLRDKKLNKYKKYPEVYYRYNKLGPTIAKVKDFEKVMDKFEDSFNTYYKSIKDFRKNFTYNLGSATTVAVDKIEDILGEKNENRKIR